MEGARLPSFSVDYRKFTPAMILTPTDDIIAKMRKRLDAIAAVPDNELTCRRLVGDLSAVDAEVDTFAAYMARLPANAATDKSVRDAASQAEKSLRKFQTEMSMRKDIFDKLVFVRDNAVNIGEHMETRRFVDKRVQQGHRNGLHLAQEQRQHLQRLRDRITEVTVEFSKNLSEDTTWLAFSEEQLAGVPASFLETVERTEDGLCKINLLSPHYVVMRRCKNAETRRRLAEARASKCQQANTPLLEELIALSHEQAQMLGYPSNAHYRTELRMSGSPPTVLTFLTELRQQLQPLWEAERDQMLALKREEAAEQSGGQEGGEETLHVWDVPYYSQLIESRHYQVDHEALREYFPIERVQAGMFEIYERLLGLRFVEVPEAEVWHDQVRLYRVEEAAEGGGEAAATEGATVGYFYLDLFPRTGKYDHFCVDSLRVGHSTEPPVAAADSAQGAGGDQYRVPVCVMLANFPAASSDRPSLLAHEDVVTFFHEFGHAMHCICSRANYSMFSGLEVENDFVEAPSQMLENWAWRPETLAMMSSHYRNHAPVPDQLLHALVQSRRANSGSANLRQAAFATFDQYIFGEAARDPVDTAAVFERVYREVCQLAAVPGTNFAASFGHLAGGYDANYYGYLWSEVFSADMFESRFAPAGVLCPQVGRQYRRCILEPGATRNASDLLRNFLGREPNNQAFLKQKGLSA